jgi:Gas vesicle synthesis protein GvpL/GvpF
VADQVTGHEAGHVVGQGRYLYAISRDLDPAALADVPGLGDGRLDVLEHRGLSAVVSDVDLQEYGEEGLRRNLERLEWLEEVARRHDEVVHAVAELGPVAPLRLATICLDDIGVRRRIDEWHAALEQVLDRVEGRREWSVKAFAPQAAAAKPAESATPAEGGAAYLRRKKAETVTRAQGEEQALQVAEEVHARLSAVSEASRRLAPQDPRLTGHVGTMTLNGAYLVDASRGEEFAEAVRAAQADHPDAGIDAAGPWPPYSFAMLEQR